MLSWLALSGRPAAGRGLTMTGGRPTWIPRGNETSATDRRHSRNVKLLMSFTARSRRTASPARRAGLAVNKHQGGKRPCGPDISNSRRVRRSIDQSSTHRRCHQHLCREDIPANWVGGQHRGGLIHRPHRRWPVAPHVQMAFRYPGNCTGCPALMPLAIVCSSTVESRTPNGWREFFTIRRICGVGRPCRERANAASTARA